MQSMGLATSEVLGVGNSLADLLAYRRAGMPAFAAGWSHALEASDWDSNLADPHLLLDFIDHSKVTVDSPEFRGVAS